MKSVKVLSLILGLLFSVGVYGQNGEDLSKKAAKAYQAKDYKQSAKLYVAALNAGTNESGNAYNAACSYALNGDKANAFKYLQKSIDLGYLNTSHMGRDPDLESLRDDPRWKVIIDGAKAKAKAINEFWESPEILTPYKENISENEKIAGLSKLWSEVKYNFVNFDLVPDVKWDALYVEYLPKVRQTKSTFEYYKVLMAMIAKLRDGHSNVYMPRNLSNSVYSRPLMRTDLIEGKVIVTEIFSKDVAAKGIKVGQEVITVGGIGVKEYAKKNVLPYQSSSTKQDRMKRTYSNFLLAGKNGEAIRLGLLNPNGKSFEVTVQRYTGKERGELSNQRPTPPFELKMLPQNVAYIALNSFGTNKATVAFEKNFDVISKASSLIIDIRRNGGGNSGWGWQILSMLTDKPFKTSKWHTREYRPAFRAWRRPEGKHGAAAGESMAHKSKLYKKPVIVLTGPATFSAAEDFAVAFDVMERGLIIGEPTGGSTGQPLFFRLPGGGSARVTTKRDSYPSGKEFVGVGIIPDMVVSPTVKDFRNGKDTVLEYALKEIKKLGNK